MKQEQPTTKIHFQTVAAIETSGPSSHLLSRSLYLQVRATHHAHGILPPPCLPSGLHAQCLSAHRLVVTKELFSNNSMLSALDMFSLPATFLTLMWKFSLMSPEGQPPHCLLNSNEIIKPDSKRKKKALFFFRYKRKVDIILCETKIAQVFLNAL